MLPPRVYVVSHTVFQFPSTTHRQAFAVHLKMCNTFVCRCDCEHKCGCFIFMILQLVATLS